MMACQLAFMLILAVSAVSARDWFNGNDNQVKWASGCDFYGGDIGKQVGSGDKCGGFCLSNSQCTHFTWHQDTCYLKRFSSTPVESNLDGAVCGYVPSRTSPSGQHIQYAIRKGQVPVRGVNLGGWLVTEYWINSNDALWNGVSSQVASQGEMSAMKALGHSIGDPRFQNHWNTYITEADIAEIAKYKLNTVRVPIGYWIIGYDNHDPSNKQDWKTFAPGGLKYLDRLINEWAPRYNIAVLVGIHGAKGSQNGADHSAPSDPGKIYWSSYNENIDNTVEVATFLAARYKNSEAFLGLYLLNEPTHVDAAKMKSYYAKVHDLIRGTGNDCVLVNSPILWEQNAGTANQWEKLTPFPPYTNVWQDWHKYLIWGFEDKSADWLMTEGVATVRKQLTEWTGNWLFIGEWCLASPGSAQFTDAKLKQYAANMIDTLKIAHSGWTYWTWKQGDDSGPWSMRGLLRRGIIQPYMWGA